MAGKPGLTIGVLALQGAYREHRRHLEHLGAQVREVRLAEDLDELRGLILPGGESTTIAHLLSEGGLWEPVKAQHARGGALWGTCAGAILLARGVRGAPPQFGGEQKSFDLLDVDVQRNAFGRQAESFAAGVDAPSLNGSFPGVFIRAPRITRVGASVQILAKLRGEPVLVREGKVFASTFHPELTGDTRLHALFLRVCSGCE